MKQKYTSKTKLKKYQVKQQQFEKQKKQKKKQHSKMAQVVKQILWQELVGLSFILWRKRCKSWR